ncbi:MAG TPA: hypothetical protein PLN56_00040 [Methanoregulaceae archaeon]|nr:MAG: hypothetical protein IPI71_05575 [Methanolinea sp.]HON80643.1 hypothetical protein [Methanoregulaceae archaeon]HPD09377.1 hypothetical protein [Methanoregulaceae archaeon]HRT14830.1 hypothetical protein [Methanoregulaceae archaeon]HRU30403.1 hypothetical protein [Methanoregulaceae archaeon]
MIMVVGLDLIIFNGIDDPSHYKDSLLSSFFEVASFSSGLSLCSIISMMQRRTEKPNTIIVMKRLAKIITPWTARNPTQRRATKQIK